jgi:hypothetical protein
VSDQLVGDEGEELLDGRRVGAAKPYVPTDRVMTVPVVAVRGVFEVLSRYAQRRVEAGMFFYGDRDVKGDALVRAIVVPRQRNHWGNYHVSAAAMQAVAKATEHTEWVNIAQLHTHPGAWVEHSTYDDRVANSVRAVSIVIPWYGWHAASWPTRLGIHEWQDGYWHKLERADAERRIRGGEGEVEVIDLA